MKKKNLSTLAPFTGGPWNLPHKFHIYLIESSKQALYLKENTKVKPDMQSQTQNLYCAKSFVINSDKICCEGRPGFNEQERCVRFNIYRQSLVKIPPIKNISSNNTLHIFHPFLMLPT